MGTSAIIALIELGLNTVLSVLKAQGVTGTDYSTFAAQLESALGPLLALIGKPGGNPPSSIVLAALGTFIGVLNTLQQDTKLPADQLAKIKEYMTAAQNATSAYLKAGNGFDPSAYTPVTPIA